MSRIGSTTTPTPRSGSETTKLALPSSPARTTSTLNTDLAEGDRVRRQKDPDRDEGDRNRAAVEHDLRWHGPGRLQPEVDEQIAKTVGEMEERHGDEHKEVQLDDRVAEDGRVVRRDDARDPEWSEDALQEDVDREQDRGDHAALREQEPPDKMHERRPAACYFSHVRKNPITSDAPIHRAN